MGYLKDWVSTANGKFNGGADISSLQTVKRGLLSGIHQECLNFVFGK